MGILGKGLGRGPLGGMPLGGGIADLNSLILSSSPNVFRRAFIKRRLKADGLYESTFDKEITEFVKRWGTLSWSIDDVRLNRFRHSGITLTVRNDTGAFNSELNINSLWLGFLGRYRTLVKIEAGYIDCLGNELPADTTQGIFILDDEIPISAVTNSATLKGSSLESIFDEVRSVEIAGLGGTNTASDIITKIRDHTDGSGSFVFRQFITSTAWTIQTTTTNYVFDTVTALEDLKTWDLMEKLAESETFVLLINRTGGIEFRDRTARQSTSVYSLQGQGFANQNIIALRERKEPWKKIFNFVRFKFLDADTSTSFVTSGTTTVVDPSNKSWQFGERIFEFENDFVPDTTTAQSIADGIQTEFSVIKEEMSIDVKMAPQLEILDRIDVSYHSYDIVGQTLWDHFLWDEANWADEGENFDLNGEDSIIISKRLNLDTFKMSLKTRVI